MRRVPESSMGARAVDDGSVRRNRGVKWQIIGVDVKDTLGMPTKAKHVGLIGDQRFGIPCCQFRQEIPKRSGVASQQLQLVAGFREMDGEWKIHRRRLG